MSENVMHAWLDPHSGNESILDAVLELILSFTVHGDYRSVVQPNDVLLAHRRHAFLWYHFHISVKFGVLHTIERNQADGGIFDHTLLAVGVSSDVVVLVLVPVCHHLIIPPILPTYRLIEGDELFQQLIVIEARVHIPTIASMGEISGSFEI